MSTGRLASGSAAAGVVFAALAVVQGAIFAIAGAYILIVAPLVGLPIALAVYWALRRRCTTGSRLALVGALGGSLSLAAVAIVGISLGGFPLLLPATLLFLAALLTPVPACAEQS